MAQEDLSRILRKLRKLTLLRPPESLRRGSLTRWLPETASEQAQGWPQRAVGGSAPSSV